VAGVHAKMKISHKFGGGDAAEVKGTQPKKVEDEIKASACAAVPGGTAGNLSLQGKATADTRQTRS